MPGVIMWQLVTGGKGTVGKGTAQVTSPSIFVSPKAFYLCRTHRRKPSAQPSGSDRRPEQQQRLHQAAASHPGLRVLTWAGPPAKTGGSMALDVWPYVHRSQWCRLIAQKMTWKQNLTQCIPWPWLGSMDAFTVRVYWYAMDISEYMDRHG